MRRSTRLANLYHRGQELAWDGRGATAIEYALIAALLAVVIATSIGAVGAKMAELFGRVAGALAT